MKKILIVIAVIILIVALVVFLSAFIAAGFDFSKIGKARYDTHVYTADTNFSKIDIHSAVDDITFKPSSDGKCSIECLEPEKVTHTVSVEDGVLKIGVRDERIWIDFIALFSKSPSITVYLPSDTYQSIAVECVTGNITIPGAFSFGSVAVKGGTGNVLCMSSATDSISITSTTGNITVTGVHTNSLTLNATTGNITASTIECGSDVKVNVTTGTIKFVDFNCGSLTCKETTGSLHLTNVIASGDFTIESTTGSVFFEKCDANNIIVKTTTGNVTGSLKSAKQFNAKSTTGKVTVPGTTTGGLCEISTTTGNINVYVVD